MRPRLHRPLLTVSLILALASAVRGEDPSPNPVQIWVDVNFDTQVNAGFGELTPGPHDMRVTFQMGVADVSSAGMLFGGLWDQSGWSMYSYGQSAPGSSSLSLDIIGVSEDTLGCIVGGGYYYNSDPGTLMRSFNVTIANATFPPAPSTCDPMGMMGGMPGACEALVEGEVSIAPGGEATVYVTVKHQAPGTLTVTSANSDIQVVSGGSTPLTWEQSVPITIRAANTFNGQQQLTCRFVHDSGGRDTQDVVKVVKKPALPCIPVDRVEEDNELQPRNPLYVAVGSPAKLIARPNPAGATFGDGAPTWSFSQKPMDSMLSLEGRTGPKVEFNPDVAGVYIVKASNCDGGKEMEVHAIKVTGILWKNSVTNQWQIPSNPMWVSKGANLQLKAISSEGEKWPDRNPVWEGTAGATGTGPDKSFFAEKASANADELKTVTATCGDTVTVNLVVYTFEGVVSPTVYWPTRSMTKLGLRETANLSIKTTPDAGTGKDFTDRVGGAKWKLFNSEVNDSEGELILKNDGTGVYVAPWDPTDPRLYLTITQTGNQVGPYSLNVIAPSGGLVKVTAGRFHIPGVASAGFLGFMFVQPSTSHSKTSSLPKGMGLRRLTEFSRNMTEGHI